TPLLAAPLPGLDGASVVSTSPLGRGPFALGLSDGRLIPVEVKFTVSFPQGQRRVEPNLLVKDPLVADPSGRPIQRLAFVSPDSGPIAAAVVGPKDIALITVRERRALIGPSTKEEARQTLALPIDGDITAVAIDGRGEDILAGTSSGQVVR